MATNEYPVPTICIEYNIRLSLSFINIYLNSELENEQFTNMLFIRYVILTACD